MNEAERITRLEAKTEQLEKDMCVTAGDIREIKDKLLQRPSWAVAIIITLLMTVCTGLIVYVATQKPQQYVTAKP